MKLPRTPSILVAALIVGATAVLQHFLLHIGEFNLNELIAPVVVSALTAGVTALQQWNPPTSPSAAARGMGEEVTPYWKRVLYK